MAGELRRMPASLYWSVVPTSAHWNGHRARVRGAGIARVERIWSDGERGTGQLMRPCSRQGETGELWAAWVVVEVISDRAAMRQAGGRRLREARGRHMARPHLKHVCRIVAHCYMGRSDVAVCATRGVSERFYTLSILRSRALGAGFKPELISPCTRVPALTPLFVLAAGFCGNALRCGVHGPQRSAHGSSMKS